MDFKIKLTELKNKKKDYLLNNSGELNTEKDNNLTCKKLDNYNKEIDQYCELVETYSHFDEEIISEILNKLINVYEGKTYSYQEAYYCQTKRNDIKRIKLIVEENVKSNFYSDVKVDNLDLILNNREALILLGDANKSSSKIEFYKANKDKHTLETCINLEKFPYVKSFIDSVISYKIKKGLTDISLEELETLKGNFVMEHLDHLEEIYEGREREELEQKRKSKGILKKVKKRLNKMNY